MNSAASNTQNQPYKQSSGFLLRMVGRETLANLKGFRILMLCLFLGVFVIGFVNTLSDALENGLRRDGKAILGGDVSVRNIYAPLTEEVQAQMSAVGDLSRTIEMRALLTDGTTENAALAELKAVDMAYPLFGDFTIAENSEEQKINPNDFLGQEGSEKPKVLLDLPLAERLSLNIGDDVKIGSQVFTFAALIANEPDRAGGATFTVGPRAMIRMQDIEKTQLVQQGAQIYYHYRLALDDPEARADFVKTFKEDTAQTSYRLLEYTNASPRVQSFLERLAQFFTLVGLSALMIGGVGIGNAVTVVLEQRLGSLAVMKTFGASRKFVFWLWLGVVVMTGIIAMIPALIAASAVPFALAAFIGAALPVPLAPTVMPATMAITFISGLLILLLFSLLPLSKGAQTKPAILFRQGAGTVLDQPSGRFAHIVTGVILVLFCAGLMATSEERTLTGGFIIACTLVTVLLHWISVALAFWFRKLQANSRFLSLRLAAGNILRLKRQSFTVLLSLGLALTLFVAIALIEDNIKNRIAEDIPDDAPAFFFIDIQKSQMDGLRALLDGIDGVSDLREVPNLRGRIEAVNGVDAQEALVDPSEGWLLRGDRGFTYLSEMPDYSELLEGEWWDAEYNDPQRPIISVVEDVARAFNVGVGDELTLNILGRAITAEIVNVRTVDWSTMTINYAVTFAPGILDNAPHSFLATVQANPEQESEVLRQVAVAYPNISAIAVRDALNTVSGVLTKIAWAVRGIAGLALVTGIMVLMSSLLSSLRQRRYETTLMKVLGAQKKDIIRVTMLEFALLGGGAMAIALVSGTATAYWVITFIMDFPWQFNALSMLSVSIVAMIVTGLGAVWAMRKAMSVSASEYLRNE